MIHGPATKSKAQKTRTLTKEMMHYTLALESIRSVKVIELT